MIFFYDICDEKGILVWQDFMFAGSMYPVDSAFLDNVEQEVKQNVIRLRNHPFYCHCGVENNEIEVAWGNWGWQKTIQLFTIRLYSNLERLFSSFS